MDRTIPINEVSWFCAHNAFNSTAETEATNNLNQKLSIPQLLDAGVRAFMIDVHGKEAWVSHLNADFSWEDLDKLLEKYKTWLGNNPQEIVLLLMEPGSEVPASAVETKFSAVFGSTMLYTHPGPTTPWPSVETLVTAGTRLIVFRETDDSKGQTAAGMSWYHDMWEYWIETDYSTTTWGRLQSATYGLTERGNRYGAPFFNLNHFDQYNIINEAGYLKARSLVAWKMVARRPTVAIDYVQIAGSVNDDGDSVGGAQTISDLNALPAVSGTITHASGEPFVADVTWTGVNKTKLGDHTTSKIIDAGSDGPGTTLPTSRNGQYCFPSDGAGASMTLVPACYGYTFTTRVSGAPGPSVTWDGSSSLSANFIAWPVDAAIVLNQNNCLIRLASKNAYITDCYQSHSGGTYYGWWHGTSCLHGFATDPGAAATRLTDGLKVYIQTGQSGMGSYIYLSANTQFNLSYSNSTSRNEHWIVERTDDSISGDIKRGEPVRLRSVEQTAQNNGTAMYLSGETGGGMFYLGTRSISIADSTNPDNAGIDWIID